jgi:hypothetical protein
MQHITTVGLDLAKSVFQVHGVDAAGHVVIRRQLKRRYVLTFFQKLTPCLLGIEACATAHHWSRELRAFGQARIGTAIANRTPRSRLAEAETLPPSRDSGVIAGPAHSGLSGNVFPTCGLAFIRYVTVTLDPNGGFPVLPRSPALIDRSNCTPIVTIISGLSAYPEADIPLRVRHVGSGGPLWGFRSGRLAVSISSPL